MSTPMKPGDPEKPFEFVIMRNVNAPRERVWRAWTEADQLGRWWGPKGFDIVSVKLDLRPGGSFHYCLRSPDGQEMWGKFVFREIAPQERLVFIVSFSDADGGVVPHPWVQGWPLTWLSTVTFAETGTGKTNVTVRWLPHEATEAERKVFKEGNASMTAGWTGTFERLDDYLVKTLASKEDPMRANPYLLFDGNCEEALTAYAKILGGKILAMMTHEGTPAESHTPQEWRKKILHGRIGFGDNVLMASDAPSGRFQKMQGMSVALNIADPAKAERVFAALAEGATVTMPLGETFWALRFGMLTDRFGTPWMINCEKPA